MTFPACIPLLFLCHISGGAPAVVITTPEAA